MRFTFKSDELETLYLDAHARTAFSQQVVKGFRKVIDRIAAVTNENELRVVKGLGFEAIKSSPGLFSMRITGQWRLMFTIEKQDGGNVIHINSIDDYHK